MTSNPADPSVDATPLVDPRRITEAARQIDPVFLDTPVVRHAGLNAAVGARVAAKVETLNPIRCFKGRGTDQFVRGLPGNVSRLVAASAGNFGQALAYCTRGRGIQVTVFAAETANPAKLEAMRRFGTDVHLAGHDFDAAKSAAREYADAHGEIFAEDSAEASYAEGAGTIGLELAATVPDLDVVLVPLGNGALAAGVGAAMHYVSPTTQVIGVVAEGAPSMKLSFEQGVTVTTPEVHTIADGIATRTPVPFGLASCRDHLNDVLAVSDDDIVTAMRLIYATLGLAVEPSAAVGVAAITTHRSRFRTAQVGVVLCGANLTAQQRKLLLLD